jgi:hypothetical protein
MIPREIQIIILKIKWNNFRKRVLYTIPRPVTNLHFSWLDIFIGHLSFYETTIKLTIDLHLIYRTEENFDVRVAIIKKRIRGQIGVVSFTYL